MSANLAWFADFFRILHGFMHLVADDLSRDFIEVSSEGAAQFFKFRPERHLDETGGGANHDGLAVHPRIAEGLDTVAAAQSDEKLTRPGIGNRKLELLGSLLLLTASNWRRMRSAAAPAADFSPAVVAPA